MLSVAICRKWGVMRYGLAASIHRSRREPPARKDKDKGRKKEKNRNLEYESGDDGVGAPDLLCLDWDWVTDF